MHRRYCVMLSILMVACCTVAHAQAKKAVVKKKVSAFKNTLAKKTTVVPTAKKDSVTEVRITTSLGEIIVTLSNKTPKHRDNFIKLVNGHFYDSLLFHRVINGFMIQGGDPTSKNAPGGIVLGNGDVGYKIPAEFDSSLYHKRGALAAARDDNPQRESSGCQFYIVQGKKYSDAELDVTQMQKHVYFSPAKRMTYKMVGGTPFLDMNYTVFGEVTAGMDVVDKIAMEPKDENNRPINDITMKMEVTKEAVK